MRSGLLTQMKPGWTEKSRFRGRNKAFNASRNDTFFKLMYETMPSVLGPAVYSVEPGWPVAPGYAPGAR